MSTVDNTYLLSLFGNTSTTSNNLLSVLSQSWANQASATSSSTSGSSVTTSINTPIPPTPPWASGSSLPQQAALVTTALAQQPLVNANAINLDSNTPDNSDYRNLFALYQGLNALDGLATDASQPNLTAIQQTQYASAFKTGLAQVISAVGSTKFDNLTLASGQTSSSQTSSAGVSTAANSTTYVGQPMYIGDASQPVPAFAGDVQFALTAKQLNGPTITVNFDLSEMGSTPRTLANVLGYLNGKLAAAGVQTRFADKQMIAPPNTITVNGKTVTLPDSPTQYALTLNTSSLETVSLSAPQTADAVYVTQSATTTASNTATTPVMGTTTTTADNVTTTTTGSTTTTTTVDQQLLKFQTDTSSTATPPPDTAPRPGDANSVAGRAWSETLASATTSALATATGPDGSVYVLTNVDDSVSGQAIAGQSDVALMKYDPSGNLIYTRTLGASTAASGLSLAVSSTGQVAIAGSVTGSLTGTDVGELQSTVNGVNETASSTSGTPDSFVTLFDASGNELWTQSAGGVQSNQANAVAFGANGQVFVAGKTQSPMQGGGTEQGGWDGYLQGFTSAGTLEFTQQFGTTGSDSATSIAVNGNSVLVGSVDNGDAVVRSFDTTNPKAVTLTASQDLGNLQGGNLVGIGLNSNGQLIVAGTAHNTALGSGVATAVNSAPGGSNVFVASLDASLSSTSGNTIAWYGGSGDDTATAMTVADGQVYVAGKTATDLPGTTPIGSQDGFLVQIDPSTGNATWTERFSGPGGNVAPQSIAVATGGASILDRLGLPSGTLQMGDPSNLLTSATSLRAGDQFTVAANGGPATTVTIEADDTMQTLAQKIERATGNNATVQVLSNGSVAQLNIKPFLQNSSITLGQGPAGKDALAGLGLKTGVIQNPPDTSSTSSSANTDPLLGLNLTSALNLSTKDSIATAKGVLDQALQTIQKAYQDLVNKGQPPQNPAAASASGPVPTYLSNEIANYQAALQRLTGQT